MRVCPYVWGLLATGCWLETVTGEPVPLDPAFYAAVEAVQGDPSTGGGAAIPFGSYTGDTVVVRGVVQGPVDGPVEIDVRTPDPLAEGGVKGHGKVQLEGLGDFELTVPQGLGTLELQAFQDPDADGPGGDDPFAQVRVEVGETDVADVIFELVPGARGAGGGGPEHREAPPGAPGGNPSGAPAHQEVLPGGADAGAEPPPGGGGGGEPLPGDPSVPPPDGAPGVGPSPGGIPPFQGVEGRRVTVSGTVSWAGAPDGVVVDIDLFRPSAEAGGGREMLGKLKSGLGDWSVEAPAGFGPLVVEAFVDIDSNGPGAGDPMGTYAGNPVVVGRSNIGGVDLVLSVTEDGRMPGNAPPGGGGGR